VVMAAAAKHLTSVTLELGGKSPTIVDETADLQKAAETIMWGKFVNAGQTCVAPDYLLVPKDMVEPLVQEIRAAMRRLYPKIAGNPDYTHIATPRHLARLRDLLDDARAKGAKIIPSHEEKTVGRGLVPQLLLGVNEQMTVMQEEIFGPLLPIVPYVEVDHALAYINRHDKPLALYWFGRDAAMREHVLSQTQAGGVTVNDCIWHLGQEEQPFGGVGASGMGAYHGEFGFRSFSKEKPVFHQSRWAGTRLFFPPYGKTFDRLLGLLKRIA